MISARIIPHTAILRDFAIKAKRALPTRPNKFMCRLDFRGVPTDALIELVTQDRELTPAQLGCAWTSAVSYAAVRPEKRQWLFETMRLVEQSPQEFSNQDLYRHLDELRATDDTNDNIDAKLRQQLQILKKLGKIERIAPGKWRRIP